jgi:hypothetical protein
VAICPLDKTIELLGELDTQDVILIGDNIEDTQVIQDPKLTLGFTDEGHGFSVNLGREASMVETLKYLI